MTRADAGPPREDAGAAHEEPSFDRVRELFLAAVPLVADEREALLTASEPTHGPETVAEVRRLLQSHDRADVWLEPPRPAAAWLVAAAEEHAQTARSSGLPSLTHLGDHRILREVGRGGMGVVFEAVEERLGRRVALKVLLPHFQLDHRLLARFRREAQAAAGLAHDHIIPVYGFGEAGGFHYYTMQFVDGVPLDQLIAELRSVRSPPSDPRGSDHDRGDPGRDPPSPERPAPEASGSARRSSTRFDDAARIAEQCADAVAHAHSRGILHRDLKPANLILDHDRKVWVGDFGLARIEGTDGLTHTGEMLGTLRYLPPEGLSGTVDARGDVYSLGLILYELLTLVPAFDAPDRAQLLARVARGLAVRPRRLDPTIPVDLETIVLKATTPIPEERYASAAALADDLRAFRASRPIAARPPSIMRVVGLAMRRHRAAVSTVILALAMLAVGAALYVVNLQTAVQTAEAAVAEAGFRSYVASVAAAQAALDGGDVVTARKHLAAAPESLRGWEWRHIAGQIDTSIRSFTLDPSVLSDHGFDLSMTARVHPDGRRVLAMSDIEARLWDLDSGRLLQASRALGSREFVWSAGGAEVLVLRRAARRIDVIALETLSLVRSIALPARPTSLVSDGHHRCAVGLDTGELCVLGLGRDEIEHRWHFAARVGQTAFSHDGRSLAIGVQHSVHVAHLDRGTTLRLAGFGARVWSLLFDPSSDALIVGSGQSVHGVDPATGSVLWTLSANGAVRSLAASADGRYLAAALESHGTQVWDRRSQRCAHLNRAHGSAARGVDFHPDGRRFISCGDDLVVRLFDLDRPAAVWSQELHRRDVNALALSPDGAWLLTQGRDGVSQLWDAIAMETAAAGFLLPPNALPAAFAPTGEVVVGVEAADGPELQVHAVPSLTRLRALPTPVAARAILFAASGDGLFVSDARSAVVRLSWPAGEVVWSRDSDPAMLAVTRNGRVLATANRSVVTLLDAATGAVLRELGRDLHGDSIRDLAFFGDDCRLATVSLDRTLTVHDVATGAVVARLPGHAHGIQSVRASPDGTRLVTSARDGILKLWDSRRLEEVFSVRTRDTWTKACFDADGRRIFYWNALGDVGHFATPPTEHQVERFRAARSVATEAERIAERVRSASDDDAAAALAAVAQQDLPPAVREGVERRIRAWDGDPSTLRRWVWRTAMAPHAEPATLERAHRWIAAVVHREPDVENRTYLGMVCVRRGNASQALRHLAAGDTSALTPALAQARLAFVTLARAAARRSSRQAAKDLRAHLEEHGNLVGPELIAEVDDALAKARR